MPPSSSELALLARHEDRIRSLVVALLHDEHAAEDVMQETWMQTLKKGPRQGAALVSWFSRVARNLALNRLRGQTRRRQHEGSVEPKGEAPSSAEIAARVELQRRVMDAIESLPERQANVLRDRYLGELTPQAIAERDRLPLNTVRSQLARAREALRDVLESEGRADEPHWSVLFLPLSVPIGPAIGPAAGAPAPLASTPAAVTAARSTLLPTALGVFAMNKLVLGTAALTLVCFGAWQVRSVLQTPALKSGPTPVVQEPGIPENPRGVEPGPVVEVVTATTETERVSVAPSTKGLTTEQAASWPIRARVELLESSGPEPEGVSGIKVHLTLYKGFDTQGELLAETTLVSGPEGHVTWPMDPPAMAVTVDAQALPEAHLALSSSSHTAQVGDEAPTFQLRIAPLDAKLVGTVEGPDGQQIEGATVRWADFETYTDAEGKYELAVASPWLYSITALAEGYGQAQASLRDMQPGDTAEVDFTLNHELVIVGSVRTKSGMGVSGVEVKVWAGRDLSAITDADGRYRLENVPFMAGERPMVYAQTHEYPLAKVFLPQTNHPGVVECDLVLVRGTRVAGHVQDAAGQPLPGAELTVGSSRNSLDRHVATSDESGAFEFPNVPAGTHKILVDLKGFAPLESKFNVPEEAASIPDLSFTMSAGRRLEGVVVDTSGEPLPGVHLSARRNRQYLSISTTSDAEGRFALEQLPMASNMDVEAYKSGFVRVNVPLPADSTDELRVVISRAGQLAGRVVNGQTGDPIESFRIRFVRPALEDGDQEISHYSTRWSDPGVTFNHPDGLWDTGDEEIEPGTTTAIEAHAPGLGTVVLPRVQVGVPGENEPVLYEIWPGVDVACLLRDGRSGEPVEGAELNLAHNPYSYAEENRWRGTTDAAGHCQFKNVAAGRVWVRVVLPDFPAQILGPFDVASDQADQVLELALAGAALLTGRVLDDQTGEPMPGVEIKLYAIEVEGLESFQLHALSTSTGSFRFQGLPPGEYQLTRIAKAGPTGDTRVNELSLFPTMPEDGQDLEFDLRGPSGTASVSGSLLTAVAMKPETVVNLFVDGTEPRVTRMVLPIEGTFRFDNLPAGKYTLMCSEHDFSSRQMLVGRQDFALSAGESKQLVLELMQTGF